MQRLPLALGAAVLALAGSGAFGQTPAGGGANPDLVRRGEYLATAGDCTACHTAPGGERLAGGLSIPTPVGDIIATNITPSRTAGIGDYTLTQFSDALRKGLRSDGAHLYPAMPYTAYAKVSDDDLQALYAYFMHAVAPVDTAPPPTKLPFPFNVRLSMAAWNVLFLEREVFKPDPARSAQWNRGAYLSRGLAHCGACHTPRNALMAEISSQEFGGGEVGTWHAPNITSDGKSGIGGWTDDELVDYMRFGHAAGKAHAAGPMAEAVDNSLRFLLEDDLRAIALYLRAVPALHEATDTRAIYEWGAASDDLDSIRGVALPTDLDRMTGPQLYDAWCATCHQEKGQGSFDGGLPPLFHSTTLGRANTNNLVMVMLQGVHRQLDTPEARMPGFAALSDRQLATLGSYLVQRYGNPAGSVTETQVHAARAGGAPSHLVALARGALAAVVIAFLTVLFILGRRRRGPR